MCRHHQASGTDDGNMNKIVPQVHLSCIRLNPHVQVDIILRIRKSFQRGGRRRPVDIFTFNKLLRKFF
jgi:hypothetical protein